jgi:hypothetical protein
VLTLINFTEVQRLVQEEINRAVGDERFPLLQDTIERLPYIQAVIQEVSFLRCQSYIELQVPDYAMMTYYAYSGISCFDRRRFL